MEIENNAYIKYNNANDYIEKVIKPLVDAFVENPEGTFSFRFCVYPDNVAGLDSNNIIPFVVDYLENVCEFDLGMFPNYGKDYHLPTLTRYPGFIKKENWFGKMESSYVSNYGYIEYKLSCKINSPIIYQFAIMLTETDLKRFNIYHKYIKVVE